MSAKRPMLVYNRRRMGDRVRVGTATYDATGVIYVTLEVLPLDGQLIIEPQEQKKEWL